jgi:hypothetical protein
MYSNRPSNQLTNKLSLAVTKIGINTSMGISKAIDTEIITNYKKFIIFVFIFIFGGVTLTGYLFQTTHSLAFLFIGIFAFLVFPFIFKKTFRKRFSQSVSVSFLDNLFSIEFKDSITDDFVRNEIHTFSDIKYFRTWDSSKNDFSTLKLIFKDGSKINYTFSGQKNDGICETDINWLFRNVVETYNTSRKKEEKIKIIPSFFSTKTALYLGLILTFAMTVVTIYFGIQKPKTLIVSIGFIGIFFQMVAMREKAIKENNKFS